MEFESTNCQICRSNEAYKYSEKGQFNLETNVVICKVCGFSYLNPRWTVERYNKFYAKEYDNYYREDTVSLPEKHIEFRSIQIIIKRLEERGLLPVNPKTILDIGSGMGHSLIYLKKNRFAAAEYFAIEPSEQCIRHLKSNNINVLTNDVFSKWEMGREKKFDVIIMRHVLEHFNEPVDILKKVKQVLSDTGIVIVAVPNSMKPTRPLKSHYFRVVHVSYFSPRSLQNAFILAGLNCITLIEGDKHDQFEIFAVCNSNWVKKDILIDNSEWLKQKQIYDQVGKSDFYYGFKQSVVRFLRKLKILK
jgi:2-polyprenyl-3-methyl-5-hydroxy-6-metoxy-1,4-benzoquinol methylase